MTSSIQTTLTGAALVAAMTLGGLTSAYAQFQQPYNEPYQEEEPIVIMEEDESLDGLQKGLWIYDYDAMSCGHEWVGLAQKGHVLIQGFWDNFHDIYHKAGKLEYDNSVPAFAWGVNIDRLWVTVDTLNGERSLPKTDINKVILQVGETTVHGETFGVKTADQKIVVYGGCGHTYPPYISYDGKKFNSAGVNEATQMEVLNYGKISDIEINGGTLKNYSNDAIDNAIQYKGTCINQGRIVSFTLKGGTLDNTQGYIDTLYWYDGSIDKKGLDNTGQVIFCYYSSAADAGMDEGEFDEGYVDEGFSDDAVIDNADWDAADGQDAAPLGEEVMGW